MNASQKPVTSQSGRTSSIALSEPVSFASREELINHQRIFSEKNVNTQGKVKARVNVAGDIEAISRILFK